MSGEQEELDLLLSLHDDDDVPETPPASPSPHSHLHDGEKPDMSVFRDAVHDCLHHRHPPNPKTTPLTTDAALEKYSGLRISNQLLTSAEIRECFSDIRFVRLSVIKNLLIGDTFSGSWATVGVLGEKGTPKTSSTGKSYCIWKIACLDQSDVSLFLFGDAYKRNAQEQPGTVFALFNSAVRKDTKGNGFSLSIFSPSQILKMGTSADYGVCKGRRADGMACTLVINKRHGPYCKYHKSKASEKYSTMRTELKGGNLRTAFRPRDYLRSEGIYLVDPLADKTNTKKSQPVKLLSVDGLRKALSNAGKVTTNAHSQGVRFLSEVTGKLGPKPMNRGPKPPSEQGKCTEKRKSSAGSCTIIRNQQSDAKRMKTEGHVSVGKTTAKMIELEYVSSDEDI